MLSTNFLEHLVSVVIVEDEDGHAYLIEKNLKRAGIENQIVRLKDGKEAIEYFSGNEVRGHQPRNLNQVIVLLDLNLPLYDGYDVLERIRSTEALKHTPIIILSSTTQEQEIKRCYHLGCSFFLNKPVDYSSFSEAILHLGLLLKVIKVST